MIINKETGGTKSMRFYTAFFLFNIVRSATFIIGHLCLILLPESSFAQDRLEKIDNGSKLSVELKDIYRAYKIHHKITDQQEALNVFLSEGTETLIERFVKECEDLKDIRFVDETLNSLVNKYIELTKQSYQVGQKKGFNSKGFEKIYEQYKKEKGKFITYLGTSYSTNRFINLTEEKYWQAIDKKNYIKSSDYPTYQSLKKTNLRSSLSNLENIINRTSDFQEYCVYQLELADQYVKNRDTLGDIENELAIQKYKQILDQKKYSLYLFETWIKWRTVTQQNLGLSKSSDIPNNEYDEVREQVALVILDYINHYENDQMAINQFLLVASHDIIRRLGKYPYGNQNTLEYHQLFDER